MRLVPRVRDRSHQPEPVRWRAPVRRDRNEADYINVPRAFLGGARPPPRGVGDGAAGR
jgi:hypothetical protein